MKNLILILGVCLLMASCSKENDFDSIVSNEWEKCKVSATCTIDFAHLMNFEWDTMCFYAGACSLEEINIDLGFELKGFTDTGDRVIFLNKGEVVYHKEWYAKPSEPPVGTIFETNMKKFRISKTDAKFRISKEGKALFLTKL